MKCQSNQLVFHLCGCTLYCVYTRACVYVVLSVLCTAALSIRNKNRRIYTALCGLDCTYANVDFKLYLLELSVLGECVRVINSVHKCYKSG